MSAEFKIGRLRYTWRGYWDTNVEYNRDAVVSYNGKTYVCLFPHTSTNFYEDLTYSNPTEGSVPRWLLMVDGRAWKQAWEPNTYYFFGNIVTYSGIVYICTEQHTSGASQLDLTKWAPYSSFDNWDSNWTTSAVYGLGDIVRYGGIVYRCTTDHVSASTTSLGLEADQSKWEIVNAGIEYTGVWTQNFRYKENDLTKNGTDIYKCTQGHTSATLFDETKWELWFPGQEYNGQWSNSAIYQPGDIVVYGGYSYICKTINNQNIIPSVSGSDWELVTQGYRSREEWTNGSEYKIGDVVIRGGYLYSATADNSSQDPTSKTVSTQYTGAVPVTYDWTPAAGEIFSSVSPGPITGPSGPSDIITISGSTPTEHKKIISNWSAGQTVTLVVNGVTNTYTLASPISLVGTDYVALCSSTNGEYGPVLQMTFSGLYPDTYLNVASTAGIVQGMLLIGQGFTRGQAVVSVINETTIVINKLPDSTLTAGSTIEFVGINYDFWTLVVPGDAWKNFWVNNTNYIIGELVSWQNITYRCIRTHTSSSTFRPDKDTNNTVWAVYAIHAKENAGNTIGDLVSYNKGRPTSISILPETGTEGQTENYLLKITDTQPNWKTIFTLPDVFYVAPTGTDSLDFGKTWDEPWKTIKYACDQIAKGFFFQNINSLLVNNKEFLVEEMYRWMLYQKENNISPFTSSSVFDESATRRDARYIIDALSHDIVRGSNSRIVTVTKAFFKENSNQTFFNEATDAAQPYIVASLRRLRTLFASVLNNEYPDVTYQHLNLLWDETVTYQTGDIVVYDHMYFVSLIDENTSPINDIAAWEFQFEPPAGIIPQYRNTALVGESNWLNEIQSLIDIAIYAIENSTTTKVPSINTGAGATIYIKTGTYSESLPIVVPENTALVGDELRGTVVQPISAIYTSTKSCSSLTDRFTVVDVTDLEVDMPIQFSASNVNDDFGGITLGKTYYVAEIVGNTVSISETIGGDLVPLVSGVGLMTIYAGDCLKDMFYMRNATGLRNMTLTGLAGSLTEPNEFTTRRPTGGAYTSLDAGNGPDDTRTWIVSRSPYMQNVTNFGVGCVGMKIDGTLHNGGNKSMVANDYTQILSDGIGVWCTGPQSLTECVSVFCYYNYAGYFAENGGRIRATNGNSSYGVYGVIAEGYDSTEVPISGIVDNRSSQVQASVKSAFGTAAELLSLEYLNAGSNYYEQTTNLIKNSNLFSSWSNDGNVTIQKNSISPFGDSDAWTITGTTSSIDASYIYQNISILPAGSQYSNVSALNITGSGVSATFDITVGSTSYFAIVNSGGSGYVTGNELRIPGSLLGGTDGTNDCFLTVTTLAGSSILGVDVSGVVPSNSDQSYTISLYANRGTSPIFDVSAIFSGQTTATTTMSYSFVNDEITTSVDANGAAPKNVGKLKLSDGWYRFWMTVYDKPALNNQLQVRIYPRGKSGLTGSTKIYGLQTQLTESPTFYLQTTSNQFTGNANYTVTGSGTGADLLGDEIRSNAVFETRITDTGTGIGGRGYLVASNNAQGGNDTYIILSGSDTNSETNYAGMRIFIQSGTGAGQYGYISSYDSAVTKVADVLKESFDTLSIEATDNTTSTLTLKSGYTTESLYLNQAVQFIPTYYTTNITKTGLDTIIVNTVIGGSTNTIVVSDTSKLVVNMGVQFSGSLFGGVTSNFTYYIKEIIDSTTFTISTEPFGSVWLLNGGTGTMNMTFPGYNNYIEGTTNNMQINMPINFTGLSIGGISVGTTYYVNEVIGPTKFTISTALVEIIVSATAAGTNYLTTTSTTQLVPLNPIKFSGTTFGGIVAGTNYYINKVINSSTFTIVSSLIETRATHTETITNLITVTSTAGFVANNPIQFIGKTTGGITNGNTYYILAINNATTFTVSATPGGSAINLSTSVCDVLVRTTPSALTLSNASGSMSGTSTNAKSVLTAAYGSMNGTYSTSLFGNVTKGTTYYISSIDSSTTFKVSTSPGGAPITLKTDTGSMNLGEMGWDHIHPGTEIAPALDNSTVYYVEPRIQYSNPDFNQTLTTINTAAAGTTWSMVAYGNDKFIAVPNGNAIAGISADGGLSWEPIALPATNVWGSIAFGDHRWVLLGTGGISNSVALYSINDGEGWRESILPAAGMWTSTVYGNGKFVAIAENSSNAAYSTNYGKTWTAGSGLANAAWSSITYGEGKFVAIASGGNVAAYSTNGINWNSVTLPSTSTWSGVAYGAGLFVAVSSTSNKPIYSPDGIIWKESPYTILPVTDIRYGQGIFVAGHNTSGVAYTSEDGIKWTKRTVDTNSFNAITFGWDPTTKDGIFVTVGGTTSGSIIKAGLRTKARVNVTSGTIESITLFEPGSNYSNPPTVTITDPNVTLSASTLVRVGSGVLATPTFVSAGQDYNTNSTVVAINGGGYADTYQAGLKIIAKNLTSLPAPGDDLVFSGNPTVYKVTNATPVYGTVAPNIIANIEISPEMTVAKSPEHETAITIRTKYSQCRLTNHDFLNVGYGNLIQSNYPNLPTDTVLAPQDQAVEVNYGRVFYTSTDQDGNFKVGNLFGVEQATGIVTLSATQFGLTGLETLSLGGIAVGSQSVVIRQFSTDSTFIANSNEIIPTQRAIKAYLTSRLSQGGANTFTGQLTAGTVVVGGADKIRSTVPEGNAGWVVNMPVMTRIHGEFAGWDGDGMAIAYFMKTWNRR